MDLESAGLVLNLYSLFIALLLLLFQESDRKSKSNVAFLKLIGILSLLVGMSAIGDIGAIIENGLVLRKISSFFVFAFDPLGFLFSLAYIDCYTIGIEKKKRDSFLIPLYVYSAGNLVAVMLSEILKLNLFYYYIGSEYYRGPLYMLRGLFHVILCILVMVYVFVFRKHISKHYRLPITLFPIIVAFGGFLQVAVIPISMEYAATVAACLILLIYVQRRDINTDYLTGVVNRRGIDMALKKAISESKGNDFAAVMIDVDYFKSINDKFGHKVGDEVLESIAYVLRSTFGGKDTVGRFGGDEFCIITSTCDENELSKKLSSVKDTVSHLAWAGKGEMDLSISTGALVYDKEKNLNSKEFMEAIDKMMYEEKLSHHLKDRRKSI